MEDQKRRTAAAGLAAQTISEGFIPPQKRVKFSAASEEEDDEGSQDLVRALDGSRARQILGSSPWQAAPYPAQRLAQQCVLSSPLLDEYCKEQFTLIQKDQLSNFEVSGISDVDLVKAFFYGASQISTADLLESVDLPAYAQKHQFSLTFPEKLMLMLTYMERDDHVGISRPTIRSMTDDVADRNLKIEKDSSSKGDDERSRKAPVCVSWCLDGTAIAVNDQQEFVQKIMPLFFKTTKMLKSFTRKLYRWGFRKMRRCLARDELPDASIVFRHDCFRRDKRSLITRMQSNGPEPTENVTNEKGFLAAPTSVDSSPVSSTNSLRQNNTNLSASLQQLLVERAWGQLSGPRSLLASLNTGELGAALLLHNRENFLTRTSPPIGSRLRRAQLTNLVLLSPAHAHSEFLRLAQIYHSANSRHLEAAVTAMTLAANRARAAALLGVEKE